MTSAPDVEPAVVLIGAGPVGLTIANLLGVYGVRTLVLEDRETLIDYPRGVGLDDESLRAFQATGLVDKVLPHTIPNQIMRFVDSKGRVLAEMNPRVEPFGWPKRNGFVQPLVDAELLEGLKRFPHVEVVWGARMETLKDTGDQVTVGYTTPDGPRTVAAQYVVGCDGGRSATRAITGTSFDGTTASTRWLVVDIRPDPLGKPNVDVGADPQRPYVSVSIAHGIRRFEFMLHANETDELAEDDTFMNSLVGRFVPHPEQINIIRRRVYTHHSRIAGAFRTGRVFLAGDAAHLMPVWQGQGYNSGIRDAANLGWKLAAVVNGHAGDSLLDSYDVERRKHAKAMIDLSTVVGKVISPTNKWVAGARDRIVRAASAVPALKAYVLEMRFKPMPRYETGAVAHEQPIRPDSPVGRLFIQPRVDTREAQNVRLDEVIGPWFAVLFWNNEPRDVLTPQEFQRWKAIGAKLVTLRPVTQVHWTAADDPDVLIVGDRTGALKSWFDTRPESVIFLRPDRCVGAASIAQLSSRTSASFADALSLTGGGQDATRTLLHVPQSVAGPAGAVTGPA